MRQREGEKNAASLSQVWRHLCAHKACCKCFDCNTEFDSGWCEFWYAVEQWYNYRRKSCVYLRWCNNFWDEEANLT